MGFKHAKMRGILHVELVFLGHWISGKTLRGEWGHGHSGQGSVPDKTSSFHCSVYGFVVVIVKLIQVAKAWFGK
jgi:hypothetical protein